MRQTVVRLKHRYTQAWFSKSYTGLVFLLLIGGCGHGTAPVPVSVDIEIADLMPREIAIEYLNTVPWGDVWGKSCCNFLDAGVMQPKLMGGAALVPYEKLSYWSNGPWPDGSYQVALSLPNVNSIFIAPADGKTPPEAATRVITALETLTSMRTRKK